MTLSNGSVSWCGNLRVGQIDLRYDNGGLLRVYISFVNTILCVQRLSLTLGRLELTLTCSQRALGTREIRFTRVKHSVQLALLSCCGFQLLMSCRLRVKKGLLAMQFGHCTVKFGRNGGYAGSCCTECRLRLVNSCLCRVDLSILYSLCRLI